MQPYRRQPIRLPHPWDSPGKNTGVGCHFLLQCIKVKSESEVAQSCLTLSDPWTAAYQAPPSMGFCRQEYWSEVPLPSPEASIEELKSSLMKVKKESEKAGWKLNIQNTKIMACSHITSWQIDEETMETVMGFIFLGSKITADGDWSHEIKRCLLLGRKSMTNLDSILKSRDITLPTKICIVKAVVFPGVMYGCDNWTIKKAEHWRIDAFKLLCRRRLLKVP